MNKDQKFVITIGRERGSGGRMVGKELARRFHIHYYDREILACASKELDVDEAYLSSIDERSMNFMQNVFPVAYGGSGAAFNYVTTEAELIGVQSRLICEFASSRSCVIVGRCAVICCATTPTASASSFLPTWRTASNTSRKFMASAKRMPKRKSKRWTRTARSITAASPAWTGQMPEAMTCV